MVAMAGVFAMGFVKRNNPLMRGVCALKTFPDGFQVERSGGAFPAVAKKFLQTPGKQTRPRDIYSRGRTIIDLTVQKTRPIENHSFPTILAAENDRSFTVLVNSIKVEGQLVLEHYNEEVVLRLATVHSSGIHVLLPERARLDTLVRARLKGLARVT